jgi:pheromone shutdown protein TraB
MASQESWFTKWLRNGRLSALTFLLVFATWVSFQVAKIPAPILDQLLLTISGVLVGNLALKKEADERRVNDLKEEDHDSV